MDEIRWVVKFFWAYWQARIPEIKRIEFVEEKKACPGEEKEISVSVGFYKLYPILPEAIKSRLFMGSNASAADVIEACENCAYFFGVKSETMATSAKKDRLIPCCTLHDCCCSQSRARRSTAYQCLSPWYAQKL